MTHVRSHIFFRKVGCFTNWGSRSLLPSVLEYQLMSLKQRKCTDNILPHNKQYRVYTTVRSSKLNFVQELISIATIFSTMHSFWKIVWIEKEKKVKWSHETRASSFRGFQEHLFYDQQTLKKHTEVNGPRQIMCVQRVFILSNRSKAI